MRNAAAILCLAAMVLVGCTKTFSYYHQNEDETVYCDPEFEDVDLTSCGFAIGGVVLGGGCALDPNSGVDIEPADLTLSVQADLWTPMFGGIVRKKMPGAAIFGWFSVLSDTPAELRQETYYNFVFHSRPNPTLLAEWAAHLPHPRYLALVRVERTWNSNAGVQRWVATSGIGRVVVLTLEIYDLDKGISVWAHKTTRHTFPSAKPAEVHESGESKVRQYVPFEDALYNALDHAVAQMPIANVSRRNADDDVDDGFDFDL